VCLPETSPREIANRLRPIVVVIGGHEQGQFGRKLVRHTDRIVGELPTLLGVSEERGQMLVRLVRVLGRIPEANPYAFALGAGVLIVTAGTARISARIPGALIGLVGAGIAVALFDLEARGVSLLGALSIPLPHLALPTLPGMDELTRCS
jgi:sulfate permease, SulP family